MNKIEFNEEYFKKYNRICQIGLKVAKLIKEHRLYESGGLNYLRKSRNPEEDWNFIASSNGNSYLFFIGGNLKIQVNLTANQGYVFYSLDKISIDDALAKAENFGTECEFLVPGKAYYIKRMKKLGMGHTIDACGNIKSPSDFEIRYTYAHAAANPTFFSIIKEVIKDFLNLFKL